MGLGKDDELKKLLEITRSTTLPSLKKLMKDNPHFRKLVAEFIKETFPKRAEYDPLPVFNLRDAADYFVKRTGQLLQLDRELYKNAFSLMEHSKDKNIREYAWLLVFLESEFVNEIEPFEAGSGFRKTMLDGINSKQ